MSWTGRCHGLVFAMDGRYDGGSYHGLVVVIGWLLSWVGCCHGLVVVLGWSLARVGCCYGLVFVMGGR